MRVRWPPSPLGLGTPLNLAVLAPETRSDFTRRWWRALALGLVAALVVMGLDAVLFGGLTVQRLPELGSDPPLGSRVLVVLVGSVGEELFFRALLATLVGWVAHLSLSRVTGRSKMLGQWFGVLVAATLAGVWHVGSPADAVRVMTISGIVGVAYGWLYWWRGLESAILAHMAVTGFLYIAAPTIF